MSREAVSSRSRRNASCSAEIPAAGLYDGGVPFPLRCVVGVRVVGDALGDGAHHLVLAFRSDPFGALELEIRDNVAQPRAQREGIPRDRDDDYSVEVIERRQRYLEEFSGHKL